jgi:DNA-binding transcriptional ArsR family regulator
MPAPDSSTVFAALADPTRRRVVQALGERPLRAGELAQAIGASRPVMSRHLRILLEAGLVTDERVTDDARARLFRLDPRPLTAVQTWVDEVRAHWQLQLRSFKQHVERRKPR